MSSKKNSRYFSNFILFKYLILLIALICISSGNANAVSIADFSKETQKCSACHQKKSAGLHKEWTASKHFESEVGCYECHQADEKDPDAIKHMGSFISVIVSPKDCSTCHEKETEQFTKSHHADAGQILGSLDNVLAEVVEGNSGFMGESAAAVSGCQQCHGSEIKVDKNGNLDPTTWPNTGIGRVNPDGSKGSCSACHQRHKFSKAQARRPENCGKCHLGPDHPQKEIYEESKHGINFFANVDEMNLNSDAWVVGKDYTAAPTCATCHMSATKGQPVTHDVGDRISWTLRPPVSEKIDEKAKKAGKKVIPWEKRRLGMKEVCSACHAQPFIEGFYKQYDATVELYNTKFATPGLKLINLLKEEKLLTTDVAFDDQLEWTWFYLWHHEGRRTRHGAAMMAPDYVQWHGFYEVAERFYMELVPEIQEVIAHAKEEGGAKAKSAAKVQNLLDEILNSENHRWFLGKLSPEEKAKRAKELKEFKNRYTK